MKFKGRDVIDATEPLAVKVTHWDVKSATKQDAKCCAMAKAVCRQQGAVEAHIHFSRAYVLKDEKFVRYVVPNALRNELMSFDRGGGFEPGDYEMRAPVNQEKLDAPKKPKNNKPETKVPQRKNKKKKLHLPTGVRQRMVADWQ